MNWYNSLTPYYTFKQVMGPGKRGIIVCLFHLIFYCSRCVKNVCLQTRFTRSRRLKADNYFLWSKKMKLLLMAKGVWTIVCRQEKCPVREKTMEDIVEFEKKLYKF